MLINGQYHGEKSTSNCSLVFLLKVSFEKAHQSTGAKEDNTSAIGDSAEKGQTGTHAARGTGYLAWRLKQRVSQRLVKNSSGALKYMNTMSFLRR
ncbi:hypothetical protein AALO_G00225940 [Alosa alosa]|uniref:Uncharacterized protein n=1 Tax=Alosa alosa TaxID=278164 RepID=A0AAV6FZE9_9TELE|nr:hypothetical protein AALO_G00225940 [Alosa alosa]